MRRLITFMFFILCFSCVHNSLKAKDGFYAIEVNGHSFNMPLREVAPHTFIAYLNLKSDESELLRDALVQHMLRTLPQDVDIIIAPESNMTKVVHAVAKERDVDYLILTKQKDGTPLPEGSLTETYRPITKTLDQTLYLTPEDLARLKGKRILLVDDVVSTGATLEAIKRLLAKASLALMNEPTVLFWEGEAKPGYKALLGLLPVFKGEAKN